MYVHVQGSVLGLGTGCSKQSALCSSKVSKTVILRACQVEREMKTCLSQAKTLCFGHPVGLKQYTTKTTCFLTGRGAAGAGWVTGRPDVPLGTPLYAHGTHINTISGPQHPPSTYLLLLNNAWSYYIRHTHSVTCSSCALGVSAVRQCRIIFMGP